MRIAIASGKGGTGKTTLATNLAIVVAARSQKVALLDCDVEEPNGHVFMRPRIEKQDKVTIPVPEVDEEKCTYCGACGDACRFSAIVALEKKVLTFPELCHGCGACSLACPEGAIRETPRPVGIVESGKAGDITFIHGLLDIGQAMAPPVIREVLEKAPPEHVVIIDAPPGTSCPVIESVKGADVVLLVTEPTPFGLNDLKLAVEMVRALGLPHAVVVNRAGIGDDKVQQFCESEKIPVLAEIEDDRRIAEAYSRGELLVDALPGLAPRIGELYDKLVELAGTSGPRAAAPFSEIEVVEDAPRLPSEELDPGADSGVSELVIISGKGGTGKTSIVGSFFALAESAVVADCDVDAADLHLLLDPEIKKRWSFSGGSEAQIDPAVCDACGTCAEYCRFGAIVEPSANQDSFSVDHVSCEGCGVCVDVCPVGAAKMVPTVDGEWFVSDTRHGPMVHARLGVARENSGKLVSLVRRQARAIAAARGLGMLISDGSPGIGCPVIASLTGAQMVLIVCEPTLSGLHDMLRVAKLTRHFEIKSAICINKADLNPEIAERLAQEASQMGLSSLGSVRYDAQVTRAQVAGKSIVEVDSSPAAEDIRALWEKILARIQ